MVKIDARVQDCHAGIYAKIIGAACAQVEILQGKNPMKASGNDLGVDETGLAPAAPGTMEKPNTSRNADSILVILFA